MIFLIRRYFLTFLNLDDNFNFGPYITSNVRIFSSYSHAHNPILKMTSVAPASFDMTTFNFDDQALKSIDHTALLAYVNFTNQMTNLMMVTEEDKPVTRGNQKQRKRSTTKAKTVNPWQFHTKREQAIRTNVNDRNHPDFDKEHEYFGKDAIGRPPKDEDKNPLKEGWENPSIQPLMRKIYNDNKQQIILDMIQEEDVYTLKEIADGKDKSYWSKKSPEAKNAFIRQIKETYPKNSDFKKLVEVDEAEQPAEQQVDEESDEEITDEPEPTANTPTKSKKQQAKPKPKPKPKPDVENLTQATRSKRSTRNNPADDEPDPKRIAKTPPKKMPTTPRKGKNTGKVNDVNDEDDNTQSAGEDAQTEEDEQDEQDEYEEAEDLFA